MPWETLLIVAAHYQNLAVLFSDYGVFGVGDDIKTHPPFLIYLWQVGTGGAGGVHGTQGSWWNRDLRAGCETIIMLNPFVILMCKEGLVCTVFLTKISSTWWHLDDISFFLENCGSFISRALSTVAQMSHQKHIEAYLCDFVLWSFDRMLGELYLFLKLNNYLFWVFVTKMQLGPKLTERIMLF